MSRVTHPRSLEGPGTPAKENQDHRTSIFWRVVGIILWIAGFMALIAAAVIVHSHPGPWPFDLQTTLYVQRLQFWPWLMACITFVNYFNDGLQATIEVALWFVVLLLLRRFRYALFIGLGVGIADGLDGLLSTIVARPRPDPHLVHVYMPEPFHSFPSGHVEHCIVYYGFLLYLSFTKPIRQWRYYWALLPLQVFAVLTILIVGYARIEAGSHWLTDTVSGYLSGALLLSLLIFIYRRTTDWVARRQVVKNAEAMAQAKA